MRITIIGATGMAGSAIVSESLERGHSVDAVARNPQRLLAHDRLEVQSLDVTSSDDLGPLLADAHTAVLAIRLGAGGEHLLAPTTARFLDAAASTATRVIIIGGAAPLRSPNDPDRLVADDPAYVPAEWQTIAHASLAQFRACREHAYDGWAYLSPPAILERGARTGAYRRGTTHLLTDSQGTSRITADDLAIAVVDEIETPRGEQHFTVASA